MTETLIERIIRHEGFTQYPKMDSQFEGDDYCIGYGHDITPSQVCNYLSGISPSDALNLLHADISRCVDECDEELSCFESLDDIRADVLVEMAFQLGIKGVQEFTHMLNAITRQDWDAASQAMLDSEWHKQTPARCEELAGVMLSGKLN